MTGTMANSIVILMRASTQHSINDRPPLDFPLHQGSHLLIARSQDGPAAAGIERLWRGYRPCLSRMAAALTAPEAP